MGEIVDRDSIPDLFELGVRELGALPRLPPARNRVLPQLLRRNHGGRALRFFNIFAGQLLEFLATGIRQLLLLRTRLLP